ncbi:hypothetical protein KY347_03235, partial [Candidatus Woesearchaeota archaeon]|nr:hypothetical protein [Candidatus Woesearchaeota archaeon]
IKGSYQDELDNFFKELNGYQVATRFVCKRLENPFYTGQGRYVMMDRTQTSEGGHHDKNQKTAFTRSEKTVVAKSS